MSFQDWLVLPTIVFAQFAGTSLWFAPNAVISQIDGFGEPETAALVSCVQAGFIVGTLLLTYFAATDRISPPLLFTGMSLAGATFNIVCIVSNNFPLWATMRVLVGISMAGVYPVGMEIAAMEYPSGLGARLGVLVGALTLGTAFPWAVRGFGGEELSVVATLATVSILAVAGGLLMAVIMIPRHGGRSSGSTCIQRLIGKSNQNDKNDIPDDVQENMDPSNPKSQDELASVKVDTTEAKDPSTESLAEPEQLYGAAAFRALVQDSRFRAGALGYFGHMWELYAFWAHVPSLIQAHADLYDEEPLNPAMTTFVTIGIGALSCALGGLWSLCAGRNIHPGSAIVAEVSLIISGICCLLAPLYKSMNPNTFLFFLLVWGAAVVSDSAQFSSLCAEYAFKALVGTALTLTTCIGFAITVVSIQMIAALLDKGWDPGNALALLGIGPVLGIIREYWEWPLHDVIFASCTRDNEMENDKHDNHEVKSIEEGA